MLERRLRDVALSAAIAGAYFVAGKIGLGLAFVNASTTAVWPPTGIALAGFLIFGRRIWPGVAIGAFLVNATTAGSPLTSLTIAAGNTLEGLVGAVLVNRYARGRHAFDHPHDVFKYAVLAGMLSTTIAATIGATSLVGGGLARPEEFGPIWFTWWLGDAAGALVLGPLIVMASLMPVFPTLRGRGVEVALLIACMVVAAVFVFGPMPIAANHYPLEFLTLPPLIWAAFRFSPRETSTAIVLLSGIAIWGTLRGQGPFAGRSPNEALMMLQAFMAASSVMALGVAASVEERKRVEARVLKLNEELEDRVASRTVELSAKNQELRGQVQERLQAEQELKASEARLREAQQVGHIGSWEWDIERNVVWWSEELFSIYGIDRSSFRASYDAFLERVHPDDRDRVHGIVGGALNDRRPFAFEHRVVRPDGSIRSVQAQGRVLTDDAGRPIRMSGIGQDVTERKRAEEERASLLGEQIARREAEEANRMKDEFLATLSHELRTPLSAIVGWADLLRDGRLDAAKIDRAVEIISRNAHVQSQLISDILDISRITSGQFDIKRDRVDLRGVVEHAIDTMGPTAQAKNLTVRSEIDAVALPIVGDSARLVQVVWNLLSNAIKFAPEGGWVRIALTSEGTTARIRVEDNGVGIAPELLPFVFDRFRSGDTSSTRRHGGLGLGLAIVRHIVELHGGQVWGGNREPGPGAVFDVVLPRTGAAPDAADGFPRDAGDRVAASSSGSRPLVGMRILVVENDHDSREAIAVLLTGRGAVVEAVGSVADALALLGRWRPHLLISDIEMPGENGYDLIAHVRALSEDQGGAIPAIAVTAHVGREDVRRAIHAGYDVHLSKPIWLDRLITTVTELTRWSEAAERDD